MASATIFPPSALRSFDERFSDVNALLSEGVSANARRGYSGIIYLRALGKEGSDDLGFMRLELPTEIGLRHLGAHSNCLLVTKRKLRQRPVVGIGDISKGCSRGGSTYVHLGRNAESMMLPDAPSAFPLTSTSVISVDIVTACFLPNVKLDSALLSEDILGMSVSYQEGV
jgi:hypothetical protein